MRPIELEVLSRRLVGGAIAEIIAENGRLYIVVHNAGYSVLGPAETFTPEPNAELNDINVPGAERVKRAARIGGAAPRVEGVTRITIESVPAPIYTLNWVSGFTALADGTARACRT